MTPDATPRDDGRTPAERFEALARRILTTPKADLVKDAAPPKPQPQPAPKKRK